MAPIAKSLMEKAGMKVDMQSMDWQTLVARRARKDAPDKGGWNVLITSTSGADSLDPLTYSFISAACDTGLVRLAVRRGNHAPPQRLRRRGGRGQAQ